MPAKIFRRVGKNAPNRPRCVSTVRDLLNRVPVLAGGPFQPIPEGDMAALQQAIGNFQAHHLGKVYGYIGPTGRSMPLLNRLALPIPAKVVLQLPGGEGFSQGDHRWYKINMNTTQSLEYTLWHRGCALSAVATAFAAKNVRILDQQPVRQVLAKKQQEAKRRHQQKDYVVRDFGAITPLTLDAWMTANNGQGYTTPRAADISWNRVANVSPDVSYLYQTKRWDARYPSPAQLRALLDRELLIIAFHPPHHFVLLTGYKGETEFLVWDVGYRTRKSYQYDQFSKFVVYEHKLSRRKWHTPLAY